MLSAKNTWLFRSPSPFGTLEAGTTANFTRSMYVFQPLVAWAKALSQLVEPSMSVPDPPPSCRCIVTVPFRHFDGSSA